MEGACCPPRRVTMCPRFCSWELVQSPTAGRALPSARHGRPGAQGTDTETSLGTSWLRPTSPCPSQRPRPQHKRPGLDLRSCGPTAAERHLVRVVSAEGPCSCPLRLGRCPTGAPPRGGSGRMNQTADPHSVGGLGRGEKQPKSLEQKNRDAPESQRLYFIRTVSFESEEQAGGGDILAPRV